MIDLFVFAMLFLWWRYSWLPPRSLIMSFVVFGALVINSIGDIRGNVRSDPVAAFKHVDLFVENLRSKLEEPMKSNELLNAALTIEAADRRLIFDGGVLIWNRFVHSFVPGQFIGAGNKAAMMFPLEDVARLEFGHVPHLGTTQTGMADAFRSFW